MPYELSFTKRVEIDYPDRYINECCIGGDAVSAALLPALKARYGNIDTGEEDWGWFMWCSSNDTRLAVDIFTDDYRAGEFRARLASSKRGLLFGREEVDTPDLEELMQLVQAELTSWLGSMPIVARVD
jgi:hypothetical protein